MRIPALAFFTVVAVSAAAPARAQTYSPDYPVCMQVGGREASYIECAFTSMEQCAQSASGRSAMCVLNPYHAAARAPVERNSRRVRRPD
jgi:hypothetical protein